ncbi:MAG: histidine kinase [Spirulinaceae cyanobacterium]
MLKSNGSQANFLDDGDSSALLRLVLFIDERPTSQEYIQQIQSYLESLKSECDFEVQIVDVGNQPYLAEHFRLVATPALVKIHPSPRQTLAGSNLITQLKKCWPLWQENVEEQRAKLIEDEGEGEDQGNSKNLDLPSVNSSISNSAQLIKLSDEIFRLKKENESLLEQLNFKDQLLAMLAHDIRSPLTAASIATETLEMAHKRGQKLSENLKEQLYKQAKSQFRIMERMVADILQTATQKSKELQIKPQKLHMQLVCEDIFIQLEDKFLAKSFQIEKDLPQDLPSVYGDKELLSQVITNLLENAVKYTPEEGKISISLLHRTSQKIQVSICDTGPGIPEEKRERIFEGHYRLQRDRSKEGYGIGLSLCYKVIRAHYGHIWVDSILGQGSCFNFTLPVYQGG